MYDKVWRIELFSFKNKINQEAFKKETPRFLWVDNGTEFYNSELKELLKKLGIKMYSTNNAGKVSIVERWNCTIKTQLWKYFSANGIYKWIDILQPLIDKYNNTRHRSTGFTPIEARLPEASGLPAAKLLVTKK